jgi:hypothetical protein
VTDINNWEKVGQAHSEYFNRIRPATTVVEVSRLINPEILVELEADASGNELDNYCSMLVGCIRSYLKRMQGDYLSSWFITKGVKR